ncbi:MAG: hypothetical protein HOV83_18020 [Catenulispora sp.]|nr:hypothetical protein [Catenulispora sp.]
MASACSARVEPATLPSAPAYHPAPVPSLAEADQAAVNQAWDAYLRLNTIYLKAAQTGVYDWTDDAPKRPMYAYAGGPYLSALERDLDLMREQGLLRTGTPHVALRRVVSVSPTSIVLEACVDDTGTDTVAKSTGKSVAKAGQNHRYPVTLRAGLYPDARWRWVESRADRSSSC